MTTSAQPTMRYRIDTVLAHGPAVKEFRVAPAPQGMTTCVSWASTPELELDL